MLCQHEFDSFVVGIARAISRFLRVRRTLVVFYFARAIATVSPCLGATVNFRGLRSHRVHQA